MIKITKEMLQENRKDRFFILATASIFISIFLVCIILSIDWIITLIFYKI